MRRSLLLVTLSLALAGPLAAERFAWQPADDLAALGWNIGELREAEQLAERYLTESVMIVHRSGRVIYQWGPVDRAFDVFSVRKSLLSLLFGIQRDRGEVSLERTLAEIGIDDLLGLSAQEKQATVHDLLAARSGVYHPAAWETPGMIDNRPARGSRAPGTHWHYNNWDFNALNTIFRRQTGEPTARALVELAEALGFEDFSPRQVFDIFELQSEHPAGQIWMSARDLARIGLLMLRGGVWQGQRIVSQEWIEKSTAPLSDLGMLGGYGLSWWSAKEGRHFPFVNTPTGSYSARGTGEQVVFVLPAIDTVIVHRGRVCGPGSELMHVTDIGRLFSKILKARGIAPELLGPPPSETAMPAHSRSTGPTATFPSTGPVGPICPRLQSR